MSDTWRFIYLRQPKSSSSAVIGSIKTQLCNGNCRRRDLYPQTDMGALALIWDSYFVFTVVRNPWTRALSAFTMFSRGVLHTCAPNLTAYAVCLACHHHFCIQDRIQNAPVQTSLPALKLRSAVRTWGSNCESVP